MPPSLPLAPLRRAARQAAARAYAPYSRFKVGAAILTMDGKVYTGCNVENASYGLCNCAERTAIFSAVAAQKKNLKLRCVVIYTDTDAPTAPCGACRQVINEFGPAARVVSYCRGKDVIDTTLDQLLPGAFGPANLGR
ncbi:MAG: cytidine deaminase [Cephaloticoccus sp.]